MSLTALDINNGPLADIQYRYILDRRSNVKEAAPPLGGNADFPMLQSVPPGAVDLLKPAMEYLTWYQRERDRARLGLVLVEDSSGGEQSQRGAAFPKALPQGVEYTGTAWTAAPEAGASVRRGASPPVVLRVKSDVARTAWNETQKVRGVEERRRSGKGPGEGACVKRRLKTGGRGVLTRPWGGPVLPSSLLAGA